MALSDDDVREITVVVGGSRRQQPQGSGCAAAAMVLGVVLVGLGELIRQVVG